MAQIPLVEHLFTGVNSFKLTKHMRARQNFSLPGVVAAFNGQRDQHGFHIGAGIENIEQLLL